MNATRRCAPAVVCVALFASAGCASDCDELEEECRECGERQGRAQTEIDRVCNIPEDEDICEMLVEQGATCPFLAN